MNLNRVPVPSIPRYSPPSQRVSAILAHADCVVVAGFTHADTENVFPSEMPGVTTLLDPLKLSPEFTFPVVQLAPAIAPWYPLPDESTAVPPVPSSNAQYPINPPPDEDDVNCAR
jgi:hypothetical protein